MKTFLSLSPLLALALAAGSLANAAVSDITPVADKVQSLVGAGFTPDKQAAVLAEGLFDGQGNFITMDHLGFFKSGVLSVTGSTGTVLTVSTMRPWKTFVSTSTEVICLSASSVTASPYLQVTSGTTALSGTGTLLSATTANAFTPIASPNPGTAVFTGSIPAPLSLVIAKTGTATALNVQVVVHGYYMP
jgi:hypothetical protein